MSTLGWVLPCTTRDRAMADVTMAQIVILALKTDSGLLSYRRFCTRSTSDLAKRRRWPFQRNATFGRFGPAIDGTDGTEVENPDRVGEHRVGLQRFRAHFACALE